jgi:hypothetical protein
MDEEEEGKLIKFRYLELDSAVAMWPVSDGMKDKALARLNITRREGESPFQAWILAMCRENDLPEKIPATEIGDAMMSHSDVMRFVWWLA